MNSKRQVIEQAIQDLKENRELVSQIYEAWRNTNQGPGYYKKVEELGDAMEKARRERMNISVSLFNDYLNNHGKPTAGHPNERYYDPNPTPVFSVGDFYRGPGISRNYPDTIGQMTRSPGHGHATLRRIDKFIKQLKNKMKRRKDLQENNPFQLTETKLKQMILEALKSSKFQDFGIPTPDEKLRSDLGDEMFDKIQGLDPEQAEIMKQSFDQNYPMSVSQESLNEMLQDAGFKLYSVGDYTKAPTMHDKYNSRVWTNGMMGSMGYTEFKSQYSIYKSDKEANTEIMFYSVQVSTRRRYGLRNHMIARGRIQIPSMFDLNLKTKEGLYQADAIMLSREKQAIEQALEQYK